MVMSEHETQKTDLPTPDNGYTLIELASSESKNFYSAGSAFSALSCAATVHIVWDVIDDFWVYFSSGVIGLFLSFLIVYAYAYVLPEPPGYSDEGKKKLTPAEAIFGFFNAFIVYSIVMSFREFSYPDF